MVQMFIVSFTNTVLLKISLTATCCISNAPRHRRVFCEKKTKNVLYIFFHGFHLTSRNIHTTAADIVNRLKFKQTAQADTIVCHIHYPLSHNRSIFPISHEHICYRLDIDDIRVIYTRRNNTHKLWR